jgi:hypothetical protein
MIMQAGASFVVPVIAKVYDQIQTWHEPAPGDIPKDTTAKARYVKHVM